MKVLKLFALLVMVMLVVNQFWLPGVVASNPEQVAKSPTHDESGTFNFESNTVEGWQASTKSGEKSISAVAPDATFAFSGQHSLRLTINLNNSDPDLRQGFAYVMWPGNLEGRTITVRMNCPSAAAGDPQHPNGMQVFVKDQQFRYQDSPWNNIIGAGWVQLSLTPSSNVNFDATQVQIVGVKLAVGGSSQVPVSSTCHVDFMNLSRASLLVPSSDRLFDFNNPLIAQQQQAKISPYWDINPGWGANAWNANSITVANGALAVAANFQTDPGDPTLDIPERKGFIGLNFPDPAFNLNYKTNRVIRAELKFAPYIGPENIKASIWVFDKQDGGPGCTTDCKWYRSREVWVGGSTTNELVFDLNNPTHFFSGPCSVCLPASGINSTSLKNIYTVGIQFYSNTAYSGTIALNNITLGGVTPSDQGYNFNTLTAPQQLNKPFGYGPYWGADPGWGAAAWNSSNITVTNGALAIAANFNNSNPFSSQTGFIGLDPKPTLNLNNKTHRVIRAEVRFDPPVAQDQMVVSIYVGAPCQGSTCKYFRREFSVAGSMINELTFDLNNESDFFVDQAQCPACLLPADVTPANLADIRKVGFV